MNLERNRHLLTDILKDSLTLVKSATTTKSDSSEDYTIVIFFLLIVCLPIILLFSCCYCGMKGKFDLVPKKKVNKIEKSKKPVKFEKST